MEKHFCGPKMYRVLNLCLFIPPASPRRALADTDWFSWPVKIMKHINTHTHTHTHTLTPYTTAIWREILLLKLTTAWSPLARSVVGIRPRSWPRVPLPSFRVPVPNFKTPKQALHYRHLGANPSPKTEHHEQVIQHIWQERPHWKTAIVHRYFAVFIYSTWKNTIKTQTRKLHNRIE